MVGAQNKIVSIEAYRSSRTADRSTGGGRLGEVVRPQLSTRSVEHRERMLRFLRMTQKDGQETQGRLLL